MVTNKKERSGFNHKSKQGTKSWRHQFTWQQNLIFCALTGTIHDLPLLLTLTTLCWQFTLDRSLSALARCGNLLARVVKKLGAKRYILTCLARERHTTSNLTMVAELTGKGRFYTVSFLLWLTLWDTPTCVHMSLRPWGLWEFLWTRMGVDAAWSPRSQGARLGLLINRLLGLESWVYCWWHISWESVIVLRFTRRLSEKVIRIDVWVRSELNILCLINGWHCKVELRSLIVKSFDIDSWGGRLWRSVSELDWYYEIFSTIQKLETVAYRHRGDMTTASDSKY